MVFEATPSSGAKFWIVCGPLRAEYFTTGAEMFGAMTHRHRSGLRVTRTPPSEWFVQVHVGAGSTSC